MDDKMSVLKVPINSIITEGQLIRAGMDDDHVIELANSIAKVGLLQPIVVRLLVKGKYQLLAGAHRLAACKRLRWTHIPAVIKTDLNEEPVKGVALIENIIRKDMSLQEECEAVRVLTEDQGMSVSQVCQLVGRSRDWINRRLAAPHLPDDIKQAVFDGLVPLTIAEEIAKVEDEGARAYILNEAIYAKRTLHEVQCMAETFKAVPSVTQAVEEGLKKAAETAEAHTPRKACDYGKEVIPMHEMRVLWVCPGCWNEIMAIKDMAAHSHTEGGERYDTKREAGNRSDNQGDRVPGLDADCSGYEGGTP